MGDRTRPNCSTVGGEVMTTWDRWSLADGWHYARRKDHGRLSRAETLAGLEEVVEARTAVDLEEKIREQERREDEARKRGQIL